MINQEMIEMLAQGLQKCDITKNYSLEHKSKMPAEMQFVMDRIKYFFGLYWKENLKELGIKESMKNYSNMYPSNLLEKADFSMFENLLTDADEDGSILDEIQACLKEIDDDDIDD